jgi:hypothetical protein
MMDSNKALAFIEQKGAVLVSGKGSAPRLVEAIVGEPISGSWWAHPSSHQIFAVLEELSESEDLLFCRLVDGKVTVIHRRLWPALVKLERRFSRRQLTQIRQEHTPSGKHVNRTVEFPLWVPEAVQEEARGLSEADAVRILASAITSTLTPFTRSADPTR